MSFGGILATALAGGAGVIGKQAGDDIEAQRKADMLKQQADIEFQTQQRLAEMRQRLDRDQTLWKTQGEGGTATLDFNRRDIEQRNDLAINQARGMIPVTQEAARAKADTEKAITKEQAADPIYLGAVAKIKLADPEVAARIAASRASAGASAASAAESRERTEGLKLNNADKRTLDKLYSDAGAILADAGISDEERAKRYGKVQTQIVLMKSKNGQAPGRDPELDTQTVTEEKINPDGTTTKVVRKEVRKPGNGTAAAPGAPAVGTEVNGYVFKGGDPNDKKNWTPKAGAKPAGGGMLQSVKPEPDYRPASDGSGRMVDVTTGRTLTPEQSAVLAKIERGEPTTPGERALLNN